MPEFKRQEDYGKSIVNHAVQAQLQAQEKSAAAETMNSLTEAEKEIGHKLTAKVMETNPMAQNA